MSKFSGRERKAIEKELSQHIIKGGYIVRDTDGKPLSESEKKREKVFHNFYLTNDLLIQDLLEHRYLNLDRSDLRATIKRLEMGPGKFRTIRDGMLKHLIKILKEENCWADIAPK